MDALSLLKSDHRVVESLFKRFEKNKRDSQGKEDICRLIVRELSVHAAIEEEAFYPTIKQRSEKLRDLVLESLEEHRVVKWLLSELESMESGDERLDAKMKVLTEGVRRHVREEERDIFPKVRKALTRQELAHLGEILAGLKEASPTHPHPRAPDEPPGNLIAGAVATVVDRGKDLIAEMQQRKWTESKRRRSTAASAKVARRPRR
jgi:hemerythrin superfamily protein